MKARLNGEQIALFESRQADELSELVRRSGGVPVCVPAVRARRRPAGPEVAALLDRAAAEPSPLFVFSTGVGAQALFAEAGALGRGEELRAALLRGTAACRGPKPVAALHQEGVPAMVRARSPYTTATLLEALVDVEVRDRLVALVHYGERNQALIDALAARGARLCELLLYEWELPEDTGPLAGMVRELERGRFAAAAFTTQIQARHLLAVAEACGHRESLLEALRTRLVVAAMGPTCARVLEELGVHPEVVPAQPKMAPMLAALATRLAEGAA